ncbi:MAG: Peptidase hyicolysin [Gemmatimonadetes bacterium]|nr:Peptidase hyicolysin [Gemmatimonadota bacterium]
MSQPSKLIAVLLVCAAWGLESCSDASTSSVTTGAAQNGSVPTTCAAAQTLSPGQVVTGLSGSSVCVGGIATAAEYALVAFNGAPTATATFNVSATGVTAPSASTSAIPIPDETASLSSGLASLSPPFRASRAFEIGLRLRERAALPSLIPSARTWVRNRSATGALRDAIPSSVTVGQLLRLNANADVACGSPSYHTGRVVAVTTKAIVVADTANPAGGYTDAEYAAVGNTFDTVVDPLDRAAFGDPSDIDGNGRVLLFFTKAVNDLTPASSTSYVGGFFYSRDLFPATASVGNDSCAGSNMGEMFYLMVPDPSRGGSFTKANVTTEVTATVAHEYQHLINASRRMYVNTAATDFEETWLDEGLAHIAEELLFYRISGLSPRQNIDAAALRASTATVAAFNNFQISNFGRYEEYLNAPSAYSPYAENDSLATRGATWAFLRYTDDHRASSDGTTWYSLVNSTTTGIANLQSVFGSNVIAELRDWGVSVLADDITGVDAQFQQQSWNFRSVYAVLDNTSVFPVTTLSAASGARSVSLVRGANVYLRFAVAAGESGTVQWTSAPSTVQFTLVRIK